MAPAADVLGCEVLAEIFPFPDAIPPPTGDRALTVTLHISIHINALARYVAQPMGKRS